MPPRSYYVEPRQEDYLAYANAYFTDELDSARQFALRYEAPYIEESKHIASYLGIATSLVDQILRRPSFHYREFELRKPDGSTRTISTPRTYLKVIQWWILDNVLSHGWVHEANHGFFRGRSYVSNAHIHTGSKHVLNLDIKSFFSSIRLDQIEHVFMEIGYSERGAKLLGALSSLDDHAPTGAPTSPMIGNMVLKPFDVALSEICNAKGYKYTRYADDISISSTEWIDHEFLQDVEGLLEKNGFRANPTKTKFMGLGSRMDITGVTINRGVNLPAPWKNWARGLLYRAILRPSDFADRKALIAGIFGTLRSIDPENQKKLTKMAERALIGIRENANSAGDATAIRSGE